MMSCSFTWSTSKSWSWCESIVKLWWKLRGSTISSFHQDRGCMSRYSGGAHACQPTEVPLNWLRQLSAFRGFCRPLWTGLGECLVTSCIHNTDCRLDASMEEWSVLISVTCSVVVTSRALNNLCSPVYFVWSGPPSGPVRVFEVVQKNDCKQLPCWCWQCDVKINVLAKCWPLKMIDRLLFFSWLFDVMG